MSILCDFQIKNLCEEGMISPFKEELINPASIDIRIGDTAIIEEKSGDKILINIFNYTKERPYLIGPKELILPASMETFSIPVHIAGEFKIKSSRAREGYDNILAVWLDPGWSGSKLTMEIINQNRFKWLPIYPGLRIGQIVFHQLASRPKKSYSETGRYNNDKTAMGSKG